MTAEERGQEMMLIPIGKLPPLAVGFCHALCREMGGSMETFLTAWTVYAQCVEGLTCADDLYQARPQDVQWFKDHKDDHFHWSSGGFVSPPSGEVPHAC